MRIAILVTMLVCPLITRADDSSLVGESGTVKMMKGNPTVRMVSEVVKIELPTAKVDASFVFHNDGPATIVLMGFPETGDFESPSERPYSRLQYSTMVGFRSYVDGKQVKVSRVGPKFYGEVNDEHANVWWTKRINFAANQTRYVRDSYTGGLFNTDQGGGRPCGFYYVLQSGASWHGPIGEAKIVCELSALNGDSPVYFQPRSGQRIGNRIVWDIKDFKPKQDVIVGWVPGFADADINGKDVWPARKADPSISVEKQVYDDGESDDLDPGQLGWDEAEWGLVPSFRRFDDVWMTSFEAAKWLHAKETATGSGRRATVAITLNGRSAVFHSGSTIVRSQTGQILEVMPRPAGYMDVRAINNWVSQGDTRFPADTSASSLQANTAPEYGGYTMIWLRPLVKALGGSSYWSGDKLFVTLPEQKSSAAISSEKL